MENSKPLHPDWSRPRVSDFVDLETWKSGRQLRAQVYRSSAEFPVDEKYALTQQIRRAAISVTANLAEGYGRYSYQENIQFCRQSRGSLYEVRDHLIAAFDLGYISRQKFEELDRLAIAAIRLVNGYIRATKKLQAETAKTNRSAPV